MSRNKLNDTIVFIYFMLLRLVCFCIDKINENSNELGFLSSPIYIFNHKAQY